MSGLANIERCNQDAANLATVSGVSGLGVVGYLANQLPGPKIDRGYNNLRDVSQKLEKRVIPLKLETEYYKLHFECVSTFRVVLQPLLTLHTSILADSFRPV